MKFCAINQAQVAKNKKFKVSDESVNEYGFRVLSSGAKLDSFKANPVGFYNHKREDGVICRWVNLTIEGGSIYAEPEFDSSDELGAKIEGKVNRNFIKGASIGFNVLSISEDPMLMLPGQTLPTVTEWELIEISVCDIPGNRNALALYDKNGNPIELKSGVDLKLFFNNNHKTESMLKLTAKTITSLGLTDNATAEEIQAAVLEKDQELASAKNELNTLKSKIDADRKAKVKSLLDAAIAEKKLTAAEREEFEALGNTNPELLEKTLAKLSAPNLPAGQVRTTGKQGETSTLRDQVKGKGLRQLERENDRLVKQIHREDKELYAELYLAEYGKPYNQ